jgi:hypothetical protein
MNDDELYPVLSGHRKWKQGDSRLGTPLDGRPTSGVDVGIVGSLWPNFRKSANLAAPDFILPN